MKPQKELKQLYGEEYVESFKGQTSFRLAQLLKYIHLDKSDRVADFACGNGILMELIAPKVKLYVGIDFSEAFIKAANEKKGKLSIPNAKFECSDIIEFCQRYPNTFDVAFAMDFSEHVYDNEWAQILHSIRSSIKPGGKLYLHTPNAEFFLEKMKNKNFIVKQFPEHVAVRTPEQNALILRKVGFKIVSTRFVPHYNNIVRVIHPLSLIPLIGKYFKARILIEATA